MRRPVGDAEQEGRGVDAALQTFEIIDLGDLETLFCSGRTSSARQVRQIGLLPRASQSVSWRRSRLNWTFCPT